jgi:predicted  nucleic acid-binding Zn-ribbon protein
MSDTDAGTRTTRRASRKKASPVAAPAPLQAPATDRARIAGEIAALVRLAELDATRPDRTDERHALAVKLSDETLETYHRALRGGRRPPVVRLVTSVCSGCHVRLHSKLDHQIRQRRGLAACPHCLRLVYDPAWLLP